MYKKASLELSMLGDSWVLDLHKAKQLLDPSSIWSLRSEGWGNRAGHAAVLEPISKGHDSNTSAIQKMAFNVVPLKIIVMEVTTGVTNENDLRLEKDKCPKRLKEETEAHRNRI